MIRNFIRDLGGHTFKFNTLSSTTLQVFQVYVMINSKPHLRFHMQRKGDTFSITDPSSCPDYVAMEAELSNLILNSQQAPAVSQVL